MGIIDEMVTLYIEGKTLDEIGQRFGKTKNTVKYHLLRNGVKLRPPNRGSKPALTQATELKIVELYQEGYSGQRVAELVNLPYSHVDSILTRYGCLYNRNTMSPSLIIPDDPSVLGYIAGIVDGEGSIIINQSVKWLTVKVNVANTNEDLIKWLARIGGYIYLTKRKPPCKPIFSWRVTRAIDIYNLLNAISPYMIIKKDKAKSALKIIKEYFRWD